MLVSFIGTEEYTEINPAAEIEKFTPNRPLLTLQFSSERGQDCNLGKL